MEMNNKIIKYIKEDADIFNDGTNITTYTEVIYVLKSMKEITEKEYLKNIKKQINENGKL